MLEIKIIQWGTHYSEFLELLQFRYEVYVKELGYLKETPEFKLLKMEYDRYDIESTHIIIRDVNRIIACARVIFDKGQGVLVLNKLNQSMIKNHDKVLEISRLMIHKNYRKTAVIKSLVSTIAKVLSRENVDTCVIADAFEGSNSYNIMKFLGFQESGFEYYDASYEIEEKSIVLYSSVGEINNKILRRLVSK